MRRKLFKWSSLAVMLYALLFYGNTHVVHAENNQDTEIEVEQIDEKFFEEPELSDEEREKLDELNALSMDDKMALAVEQLKEYSQVQIRHIVNHFDAKEDLTELQLVYKSVAEQNLFKHQVEFVLTRIFWVAMMILLAKSIFFKR